MYVYLFDKVLYFNSGVARWGQCFKATSFAIRATCARKAVAPFTAEKRLFPINCVDVASSGKSTLSLYVIMYNDILRVPFLLMEGIRIISICEHSVPNIVMVKMFREMNVLGCAPLLFI